MRSILGLVVLFGSLSALSCPSQYQLLEGRCIRPLFLEQHFSIKNDLPKARSDCAMDGAHLPIIRSTQENTDFRNIVNSFPEISGENIWMVMDLVCNQTTRRLEWIDGSPVTYHGPDNHNFNFDCWSSGETVVDAPNFPDWVTVPTLDSANTKTVLCVKDMMAEKSTTVISTMTSTVRPTESPTGAQCGEYSMMMTSDDAKKPCYKVFTDPLSWNLAQHKCAADFGSLVTINTAEENKYFWRTAISNNMVEGMHIGAHQSPENPSVWTWSDGEVPFDGKTYDNFVSFFPIPGGGNCAAMMTETSSALWTNEDCDANEQPFICRRADFSTMPQTCPTAAQNAVEDIFSPGLPNSAIPCEYMFFVAANKRMEIEIMTLVANNGDFLEILEGTSGPHLLANLTGMILTPTTFKTEKSNVMRINWKPNGTGSGRGFRIRYNEVDE